jgi:hypothetical protein
VAQADELEPNNDPLLPPMVAQIVGGEKIRAGDVLGALTGATTRTGQQINVNEFSTYVAVGATANRRSKADVNVKGSVYG